MNGNSIQQFAELVIATKFPTPPTLCLNFIQELLGQTADINPLEILECHYLHCLHHRYTSA